MTSEPGDPKSKRESPPSEPTGQPSGDQPASGAARQSMKDRLRQLLEFTDQGLEPARRREMLSVIQAEQLVHDQVLQFYRLEVDRETLVALCDARAVFAKIFLDFSRRPDLTIREDRLLQRMVRQSFRSMTKRPEPQRPPKQRRAETFLG